MITYQKLRKVGNSYVVTIPKEDVDREEWVIGQPLAVTVSPVEIRVKSSDQSTDGIKPKLNIDYRDPESED